MSPYHYIYVSFSELNMFRTCPHKWELSYVDGWESPEDSAPLARGSLWHKVMEAHYRTLKAVQESSTRRCLTNVQTDDIKQQLLVGVAGEQTEVQELVEWMYDGYIENWSAQDEEWTIVDVEQRIEVRLPTRGGRASRFWLKGFVDLIINWNGFTWLVDHKTGRNFPNDMMLGLNDQFGLYCWGWRNGAWVQVQSPYQPGDGWVQGILHNHARTQRNKGAMALENRFQRYLTYRSDEELDAVASDAFATASRAYAIPRGQAERTPDGDKCSWCQYKEPCLGSRKGVDEAQFLNDLGFIRMGEDRVRH